MLQRVVRSTIIDAPIERVWAVLRDFNSHDQWHAVVDKSLIERSEASDQVGCIRNFTLKDGNRIREQLLSLDDRNYKSTYCIVESTVPLRNYVATITLKPVTDGNRTFWHWESSFLTPPGQEKDLSHLVAHDVYESGFENLRRHLLQGKDQLLPGGQSMPSALPAACRRAVLKRYGNASQLVVESSICPAPAAGQVRIRQRAVGVNYFDVYLRKGWMPNLLAEGGTPGMEAAGSVVDVGEGVSGFLPGDRVAYLHSEPGSYSNLRCVSANNLLRLPAAIDDEVAVALLLKGITADYLLRDLGRIGPGTRLLVHAAAGGVGLIVANWARRLGATVIGTVSSEAKAKVAREYGCEHVILTSDYKFADDVQCILGGADVVIDGLGDAARDENFAALAPCGHWISLGQATGALQPIDPNQLVSKSVSFSRPVVFDYVAKRGQLQERASRVWTALADGSIKLPPIERHSLEAVVAAHERLESRQSLGCLILLT
jgi:NADPH:quinone reductase